VKQLLVYIGTYTTSKSKGIYLSRLNLSTGKLSSPTLVVTTANPSFLAAHPHGKVLYAVGEISDFGGHKTGIVSAFSIAPQSGKLTLLNQQPSGGAGPCHVSVDAAGKCVLTANYASGRVAVLPIAPDGQLGEWSAFIQHAGSSIHPRQAGPHAHFITTDPSDHFALVCEMGLDKVFCYRFDASKGSLLANDLPALSLKPGAGPRHLAFHPNGRYVYVVNELNSTVTGLTFNAGRGALEEMQTLPTLPEKFSGENTAAEIQVHPSGKFVYASNRGHDSIALFSVAPDTGKLTSLGHQETHGKTPRHFALEPGGRWLVAENQGSDSIVVFSVDTQTGRLTPTRQVLEVCAPSCVVFLRGS
jgi:6-phosphogluconolactonase